MFPNFLIALSHMCKTCEEKNDCMQGKLHDARTISDQHTVDYIIISLLHNNSIKTFCGENSSCFTHLECLEAVAFGTLTKLFE